MKLKLLALLLVMTFLGFSLSGCGCFMQAQKGETPAPQAKPAPPPPPPPSPAAKAPPPAQAKVMVFEEAALFDFDKADLKPQGKDQIKRYRDEVQADMSRADKIKITGYTDSTGVADYNRKLSLQRAETVRDYLVSLGADPKKMEVSGAGEANLIADNKTKEGRAKNRRVRLK